MVNFGKIVVEGFPSTADLRKFESFEAIGNLGKDRFAVFIECLVTSLINGTQRPKFSSARVADELTTVVKVFWNEDSILAALVAAQSHCFPLAAHVD